MFLCKNVQLSLKSAVMSFGWGCFEAKALLEGGNDSKGSSGLITARSGCSNIFCVAESETACQSYSDIPTPRD